MHSYSVALWAFALQTLAALPVAAAAVGPDDGEVLMQTRLDSKALVAPEPTTTIMTTTTRDPYMLAVTITVRALFAKSSGACNMINETLPGFRIRSMTGSHRGWVPVFTPCGNITSVLDWNLPLMILPEATESRVYYYMTLHIFENQECRYEFARDNTSFVEAVLDFECPGLYPANARELVGNSRALFNLDMTNYRNGVPLKLGRNRCAGNIRKGEGRFCVRLVRAQLSYAAAPYPHQHEEAPHLHCNAQGDPHYRNWTRQRFDYQGGGEMLLAKTTNNNFNTQVYNCPLGNKRRVSITVGVAVQIRAGDTSSMVTWFNGTTAIDGVPMPPGLWCIMNGQVKDGLASHGCSPLAGVVQILEMPIIKGPTNIDGGFSEIQISKKVLRKRQGSLGYVLRVYADLPTSEANQTDGLCSGDETNAYKWHVNTTFFLQHDLDIMNQYCCPTPADCPPLRPSPPPQILEQWTELCECTTEASKQEAIAKCADVEDVKVDHDACLLDFCFTCDPDVAEGVVETAEEEEEGVPVIDISVLPSPTTQPPQSDQGPPPPPPPPPTTTTVTTVTTVTTTTTVTTVPVTVPPPPPAAPIGGPSGGAPTAPPTQSDHGPPVAASPTTTQPHAVGDPHCLNAKGEHFDIHATGRLGMVTVPKRGRTPGGQLLVYALVTPVGKGRCAATVIKRVDITGTWSPMGSVQLEPGNGEPKVWRGGFPLHTLPENVTRKSYGRLVVQAGPVRILVRHRRGDKTGINYLDLSVTGLQELGLSAGGLLGIDNHTFEAKIAKGCDPHAKISLNRMRFSTDAVEEEISESSTGRLLSRAEAPAFEDEEEE